MRDTKRETFEDLAKKIDIYADGVNPKNVEELIKNYHVRGFTTNPTLMKDLGVKDYKTFAGEMLEKVSGYPVSFEVIADSLDEMERQARLLSSFSNNVYVKIPVTNTNKVTTSDLIRKLSQEGVKINTTAVFTREQIDNLENCFESGTPGIISIFAGRIANAGEDAKEYVHYAVKKFERFPNVRILWASPREVYNLIEAIESGAHIITMQEKLIKEAFKTIGKTLEVYSQETVKMFYDDANKAGYSL